MSLKVLTIYIGRESVVADDQQMVGVDFGRLQTEGSGHIGQRALDMVRIGRGIAQGASVGGGYRQLARPHGVGVKIVDGTV